MALGGNKIYPLLDFHFLACSGAIKHISVQSPADVISDSTDISASAYICCLICANNFFFFREHNAERDVWGSYGNITEFSRGAAPIP